MRFEDSDRGIWLDWENLITLLLKLDVKDQKEALYKIVIKHIGLSLVGGRYTNTDNK